MTQSEGGRRIPVDSFRIRLAIVRTEMGWNYDQAQAATGISSESWRLWEKGQRHCSDVIGISRRIAEVTPYDQSWLALGGPLGHEETPAPRPRMAKASARGSRVARTYSSGVSSPSIGEYMRPRIGRSPIPAGHKLNRYRYRFTGNQLADVAASLAS